MTQLLLQLKKLLFVLCLIAANTAFAGTINEARNLIERVLPGSSKHFVLKQIPTENGKDVFEIEAAKDGKIILSGNSAISVATAFNWYLKYNLLLSYDWQAVKPLSYNGKFPTPENKVRRVNKAEERFFNNTCTFGYTYPFWNWEKWQRMIDWMAMNSINRPLMQAGQEYIWLQVWKSFGLTDSEIKSYFTGPAHLPWHRMANMDSWGGPLPDSYINGQMALQKQILKRSRDLGMKPILTAFAGHVPQQLKRIYPNANIKQIKPGWGGFDKPYATWFLDPEEKLFEEIQIRFLKAQRKIFGTDHLYSTDPFNEIDPPSWEPSYLAKVGKTIYNSMTKVDKKSVWYQMSWTFLYDSVHWTAPRLEAMIKSVPRGKLVFLDYACEERELYKKTDNFHGAPFVWCYLGNFGGNTHLASPMRMVDKRITESYKVPNMNGLGLTLEGINVNPVIFEMVLEHSWYDGFKLDNWLAAYSARRTQQQDPMVLKAWEMLNKTVFVDSSLGLWNHSVVFQTPPVLDLKYSYWSTSPKIKYSNSDLANAIEIIIKANSSSKKSDNYAYDVMNLTRQTLGNLGAVIHGRMVEAYKTKNLRKFEKHAADFLELGQDIDVLLGTRHEFLLGTWIADAEKWGVTSDEKAYYARNAREIITTWHKGGSVLTDYANRQLNGLMRTYYMPRWEKYIALLKQSLLEDKAIDEAAFKEWRTTFEQNWVDNQQNTFITQPHGDAVETAVKLFEKYKIHLISDYYALK